MPNKRFYAYCTCSAIRDNFFSLNFISCTKLGLLGSHYFMELGVETEVYVVGNLVSPPFHIPCSL